MGGEGLKILTFCRIEVLVELRLFCSVLGGGGGGGKLRLSIVGDKSGAVYTRVLLVTTRDSEIFAVRIYIWLGLS